MTAPHRRRWRSRPAVRVRLALLAGVVAVGAVTLIVVALGGGGDSVALSASSAPVRLSTAPLGLNVGPWDGIYAAGTSNGGGVNVMQPLLKAAGIGQFRYGGSYADYYDWQTNTSAENCLPDVTAASYTSRCAAKAALGFSQFSQQAKAIGASSFVTVNYGSGTPAEAAAWVSQAIHTPGEGVALWEIGNESYGCWEVDDELAAAPAHYRGYRTQAANGTDPTCPQTKEGNAAGTQTLATSYAANAQRFLRAMKAADPSAEIGVPWAFGSNVPGAEVPDNSEWNSTVLAALGKDISFVDVHYYPFFFTGGAGGANPGDQQILHALKQIPSLEASIRAKLDTYNPGTAVVVGETSVSNNLTTTGCTPAGALFSAGDALSWLAAGAQGVDWWDLNHYGDTTARCVNPDYGFFTSSSPPVTETPYYGYLLASMLAKPHALLGTLGTSDPARVLAFQSALPGGKNAIAFINTDTSSARTVSFRAPAGFSGTLDTWSYSAGKQNATNSAVVRGMTSAGAIASGIVLPAESVIVLETQ